MLFYLQDMEAYRHGDTQEQKLFERNRRYQLCICCLIRQANYLYFLILRLIATYLIVYFYAMVVKNNRYLL